MGDHVFISYDREDLDYVTGLTEALTARGIETWSDAKIDPAAKWSSVIRERLDSSAAVIVVMSPAAEESEWVDKEVHRAEGKKPIFPLLLKGKEPLFILGNIQYEDVSGGGLPSEEWFDYIGHLAGAGADETVLDRQQREDEARLLVDEQGRLAEERRLAEEQARQEAEARRLAEEQAAEEEARRQRQEDAEAERRRAAEEEERRKRRLRAILIGVAAAVVVVAVVGLIIAIAGGDGGGGGDGVQTAEVTVPGDQAFTETGVVCEAGATLTISADGTVFHNEQTSTGPDGDPSVPAELNVVGDIPHAALIGRIGEGDPFPVGTRVTGTCPDAGPLSLGINDVGTDNNSGEFNATIEVQPGG